MSRGVAPPWRAAGESSGAGGDGSERCLYSDDEPPPANSPPAPESTEYILGSDALITVAEARVESEPLGARNLRRQLDDEHAARARAAAEREAAAERLAAVQQAWQQVEEHNAAMQARAAAEAGSKPSLERWPALPE